jgi:hydrogenase maturation factor
MSKIVKITESEIVDLVKKIVKEQKATTRRKTIKEDEDSMGKYIITHAGVPVNQIMISVELADGSGDGDVNFTIDLNGEKPVIVDMTNYSEDIDDEEVKAHVERMIENGAIRNAPDFISFDIETGELNDY